MRLASTLALFACACSCGARPSTTSPSPVSPGESAEAEPTDVAYEVHEWGLMRGGPGDALIVSSIAPPVAPMVMAVDKPVLYFHADGPLTLRSVRVHAEGGTIEEHWPLTPRTGIAADLGWYDVSLAPGETCAFTPLPTTCPTAFCEVPSLATVRVPGADCVHTAGGDDALLFYRARQSTYTPPLVFERSAVYEDVTVRNEGDDPIPGWLVRLHSQNGQVVTLAVRPPAPHGSIVVGHDFGAAVDRLGDGDMPAMPGSHEPGRRAVDETLREIGLTAGESEAFLRAWDGQLFGLGAVRDGIVDDEDLERAPTESFLYFLPEREVDRVAQLTFDPPPREVHRAMAMWSAIPASGSSH